MSKMGINVYTRGKFELWAACDTDDVSKAQEIAKEDLNKLKEYAFKNFAIDIKIEDTIFKPKEEND